MKPIAAMLVVFLAVVTVGETFQCFECNTVTNSGCKDPFDPSKHGDMKQNCLASSTCLKTVTGDLVIRSCNPGNVCATSCSGDSCIYCCEGNACNSAGRGGFNLVATTALVVLARMFY